MSGEVTEEACLSGILGRQKVWGATLGGGGKKELCTQKCLKERGDGQGWGTRGNGGWFVIHTGRCSKSHSSRGRAELPTGPRLTRRDAGVEAAGKRVQLLESVSVGGSYRAKWRLALASSLSRPGRSVFSWRAASKQTSCDWRWGSHDGWGTDRVGGGGGDVSKESAHDGGTGGGRDLRFKKVGWS